jgi:hypothetical protein
MIVPVGVLPHEIPAGQRGDAARFDHEGYAVSRQMFPPDVLRKLRDPHVEALVADGQVEPVDGEPDRFRWVGDRAGFDRHRPPAEALAPRWHTTHFEVGDALLFRPDIVHSTAPNGSDTTDLLNDPRVGRSPGALDLRGALARSG